MKEAFIASMIALAIAAPSTAADGLHVETARDIAACQSGIEANLGTLAASSGSGMRCTSWKKAATSSLPASGTGR